MALFVLIMRSVQVKVAQLLLCILFVGLHHIDALAQVSINTSVQYDVPKQDTTIFLGDWVLESSVVISFSPSNRPFINWRFNPLNGLIQIKRDSSFKNLGLEKMTIKFSSLPITLPKKISLNPKIEYTNSDSISGIYGTTTSIDQRNNFDSDLTQSGSLSRGIIVGSNQDFALESGLQFELNGQLTDDIQLDAVLTDQSIPIQPDGTTQSIREFDKVLIRLRSENNSLEMGDVDVSLDQSTFAKLNRRLQGATATYQNNTSSIDAALSSVRGTFLTQQFSGSDGVQGPYRLKGKNGEEFVIILAATERVYINGIEVQRGEENEYIIDYGLGEITFTEKVFIKDETRIYVEYEYIDQDFTRTLIAAEVQDTFLDDRFKLGVSVIRQADGDELLSQQTLSENDISLLAQVGDDLNQAIVSGVIIDADGDEFNVRYALVDTTLNGELISIYKNIPESVNSNLIVRFSNVGEGNGSYQRVGNVINGLLYEWIGAGKGSYEPFRRLPAPQKQQMIAFNSEFNISNNISWSGEFALSDFDRNRFSSIGNDDNKDVAFETTINARELEVGTADLELSYYRRQSGNNFEFFERTREIEFDRKWNLTASDISGEKLDELRSEIKFSEQSKLKSGIGKLSFSGFESTRQNSQLTIQESDKFTFEYNQEYINSDNRILNTSGTWFRQLGKIETQLENNITPFLHFEHEIQKERNSLGELALNSQKFLEIGPGITYSINYIDLSASYILRQEEGVINGYFAKEATAKEQRYQLNYLNPNGFKTTNRFHFRNKSYSNSFEELGNSNQNGFQLSSNTSITRDSFSSRFTYQASTQRQALKQEAYIEVGPEIGQYVWIDENENGIEEIDEFFPELSPNEGTFVLQFLPSDELLPVIDLNTRLNVGWEPFNQPKSFSAWLQSIRLNTLVDVRENSITQKEKDVYLLKFNTLRNDSTTINGLFRFEQTINVDPTDYLEFQVSYNSSDNLNRRTSELQRKKSRSMLIDATYRLNEVLRLNLDASFGKNKLLSDEISNRSYDIRFLTINPGLVTRFSRSLQVGFNAGYSLKNDERLESVNAQIIKFATRTRAYLWGKIQTSINLELRNTKLEGSTNSFSFFELTEGTGVGTNLVWSLNATYKINNLVRLNFTYDGRTVKERPDIHTLKMVVSAVF